MDRSDAPLRRRTNNVTETPRMVTRRSALSGAAGLAMLASARLGFAQTPAENDLTQLAQNQSRFLNSQKSVRVGSKAYVPRTADFAV